uniref:KaiC domain-containing protein n=2 Tax=Ignisphaera aggregans TaxID=334771 RepID=A0A7C5UX75_9CREN
MGNSFTFGVAELDKLFSPVLKPPSTIVIAGHPGAGKTTLASTICYANALNNNKCLYISFQEDEEKFFTNMKRLGIDFYALKNHGLIKYVSLPLYANIEDIVNEINNIISSGEYRVIAIDSINALLQTSKEDYAKRAWLQNYFYNLPKILNGICILVSELALGEETLKLGAIEFVADAIIVLKHKISSGLITRKIEVRKARSASLHIAEFPFLILEGKGIKVYIPPLLEKVAREGPEIDIACSKLRNILDHLHKGMTIYITYPPDARPLIFIPIFIGLTVLNNLKTHVISYLYPPETIKILIQKSFSDMDINYSIIENILNRFFVFNSINPFTYSVDELLMKELSMVLEYNSDIVIFHGIDILQTVAPKKLYIQSLYNQLNYLKDMGKLVVRLGGMVNEDIYRVNAMLSDVVMRHDIEYRNGAGVYKLYIWRRGIRPHIIQYEEILECCNEIAQKIKSLKLF